MNTALCQSPMTEMAMAAGRMGIWECRLEIADSDKAPAAREPAPAINAAIRQIPVSEFSSRSHRLEVTGSRVVLSPELQAILGLAEGEFDERLATLLGWIRPGHRRTVLKAFAKSMRDGVEAEVEVPISRGSRISRWFLVRGRPQAGEGGRVWVLLGVAIDITARKARELQSGPTRTELEHKVAAQTKQLKATSQELDAFCYSVSHDLRAPLRSIRGFNEVLLERYAARLDERGREFLRRACESTYCMERLIDDLLKLSRVGRSELAPRPLDLSQLATAITESLRASAPERRATFRIASGLKATGDERLVRMVLENLLGNAWKFTGRRPEAQIEFNQASDAAGAFFVRDNGAGFDPAYSDRLFGLFQRLHAQNEFEGTGVGLAIVKRIVSRHGGRVWAEGALEGGATFYFSLANGERT